MSRIKRNSKNSYFQTRGLKDRPKELNTIGAPHGMQVKRYGRRPEVGGVGPLYKVSFADDSDFGHASKSKIASGSVSADTIFKVPEGTVAAFFVPTWYSKLGTRAWSTGTNYLFRMRYLDNNEEHFHQTDPVVEADVNCDPLNEWFGSNTNVYHSILTGTNVLRFYHDQINTPTSRAVCNVLKHESTLFIRFLNITKDEVIIDAAAYAGIEEVTLVEESSLAPPPPAPPAPELLTVEASSETIVAKCSRPAAYISVYQWYVDGVFTVQTKKPMATITDLTNFEEYEVTVRVIDERGLESEFSNSENATPVADSGGILYAAQSQNIYAIVSETGKTLHQQALMSSTINCLKVNPISQEVIAGDQNGYMRCFSINSNFSLTQKWSKRPSPYDLYKCCWDKNGDVYAVFPPGVGVDIIKLSGHDGATVWEKVGVTAVRGGLCATPLGIAYVSGERTIDIRSYENGELIKSITVKDGAGNPVSTDTIGIIECDTEGYLHVPVEGTAAGGSDRIVVKVDIETGETVNANFISGGAKSVSLSLTAVFINGRQNAKDELLNVNNYATIDDTVDSHAPFSTGAPIPFIDRENGRYIASVARPRYLTKFDIDGNQIWQSGEVNTFVCGEVIEGAVYPFEVQE